MNIHRTPPLSLYEFRNLGTALLFLITFPIAMITGCGPTADPPAQTDQTSAPAKYTLGEVVKFGAGGGSERFRREGWSDTEKDFTWTMGQSAKLLLSLPTGTARPLKLRMRLTGFIKPPELPSQTVELYANGERVADWTVTEPADFSATIPVTALRASGELTIELKTPKAASPKSLNVSSDPRVLGVSCSELVITKQ